MYQIYFNKALIYDPREDSLAIRDPSCHLAVGSAGELSFTIDEGHPYAGALTKLTGIVELRADGRAIYKGRVRKDTRAFDLSREIETEGLLACLNDSIIPPYSFPDDWLADPGYQEAAASGNVIQFFLGWLLEQHNNQTGPEQQIHLGDVTVTDPNNYISRASSEYSTTMDAVRGKLEDLLGGYFVPDYSGDTTVLHYYADLPLTNIQAVEYGENLLDLVTETDAAETYTAILPVGSEGLTIADLPDGEISPGFIKQGPIIYSHATEEQYNGMRVTRKVDWSDVTIAENLQTKALALLSTEGTKLAQTITVKAMDLGGEGAVSRFVVGRYVRLESTPHGFGATYPLMELDPDILDPAGTVITLGVTVKAASDLARSSKSGTQETLSQMQLELTRQQGTITALNTPTSSLWYVETIFYNKLATSDRRQVAMPYRRGGATYSRYYTAGAWTEWESEALAAWPVGSIYLAYNHTNPATLFGGTWTRIQNAFLWATTSTGTIGQTGGEREVTLTEDQIPAHNHGGTYTDAGTARTHAWLASGGSAMGYDTVEAGGGEAHNNMPPYIQVSVWRRTA